MEEMRMSKITRIISMVFLGATIVCVPLYLLTHILVIGVIGYSTLLIGSITILGNVIGSISKRSKKEANTHSKTKAEKFQDD